ncbi:putative Zn-dependent peptidase [Hydrogenivirga caldilitoris]|uniref:Putative Zn-dependent peptidase n=1 Tax=Hydrogenivirga caldilitoris TaxID=246264 RepID=A0A497XN51_9AQUI|nr:pitrilysin family protein [Hydrogenivirga caldilitoris]RLJ70288.1 putative Zn-dependent peptidase [Hydrogenivirga caldilitoris]
MRAILLLAFLTLEVVTMGLALAQELYIRDLPNGGKLIVKPRDDTSAVALHVWFRVGSIYEKYDEKGMAHFLEHMLFNGSEKYPYGEVDKIIESLGGNINAGTSKDFTYYHIEIAAPYWREALEVLYQITLKALLDEKMIEKEKEIVIEELRRGKDNPSTVLWETFEKTAYKVSPYRFPVIGFENTIRNFTRDMLLRFYRDFYQPRNMAVIVVGNVNPEEVEREVTRTFGREEGRPVPKVQIPNEPEQIGARFEKLEDPRVEKAYWIIGWRVPPIGKTDYYGLVVLDEILGSGRTSVLYRELREKGLVYSYFAGDLGRPRDNMYVISATFDPDKYEEVKEKVLKLLEEVYKSLTEKQVESAKQKIISSRIFEEEKVEGEAYDIGYSYTVIRDIDFYRFFEKNVGRVRKVDVMKVYEKYLSKGDYVEVLMLPKGGSR